MPAENYLDINQQYDISYVTTAKHKHEQHKKLVPQIIKRRKLNVNTDKIEENEVERNGNEDWKKCKLVGSLIDTTTDITTGTDLTIAAYNKLKKILERRRVSIKMKIKVKNTYIKNIFLYNSEIWSVTKELEITVDVFQRSPLRRVMNIFWPEKISNEVLYERTKTSK